MSSIKSWAENEKMTFVAWKFGFSLETSRSELKWLTKNNFQVCLRTALALSELASWNEHHD